jgi:hypothetical protein
MDGSDAGPPIQLFQGAKGLRGRRETPPEPAVDRIPSGRPADHDATSPSSPAGRIDRASGLHARELLDPASAPSLGGPGPAVRGQRQPQAHPDQPKANNALEPGGRLPGAGPPAGRQPGPGTVPLTVQVGNALRHEVFDQ